MLTDDSIVVDFTLVNDVDHDCSNDEQEDDEWIELTDDDEKIPEEIIKDRLEEVRNGSYLYPNTLLCHLCESEVSTFLKDMLLNDHLSDIKSKKLKLEQLYFLNCFKRVDHLNCNPGLSDHSAGGGRPIQTAGLARSTVYEKAAFNKKGLKAHGNNKRIDHYFKDASSEAEDNFEDENEQPIATKFTYSYSLIESSLTKIRAAKSNRIPTSEKKSKSIKDLNKFDWYRMKSIEAMLQLLYKKVGWMDSSK